MRNTKVVNQECCVVNLGTKNTRRFLVILKWGLKIAIILIKIDKQVACGIGGMIPNFRDGANFATLILDTSNFLDYQILSTSFDSVPHDVERVPNTTIVNRSAAQN